MKVKLLTLLSLSILLFSCQKESTDASDPISQDVLNQIEAQGFSSANVFRADGGYVIEGDIFLTQAQLNTGVPSGVTLRAGDEEQYRTTNLIKALPRTITVSMHYPNNVSLFNAATDEAIGRYNARGLRITFQRIASGTGEIDIIGADLGGGGVLGRSSGFPTSAGNPATPITLNSRTGTFTDQTNVHWLATIIAHEIGHTIGFRHTDYKNRSYSCGGFPTNEGSAGVGAIYIPGTKKGAKDPGSWMLSCTDGTDRPFNPNDRTALDYLYK